MSATAKATAATTLLASVLAGASCSRPPATTKINDEIFEAFKEIEIHCLEEEWPHETVRCQHAREKFKRCGQSDQCTAEEIYEFLFKVGFDLPPYTVPIAK